MTRLIKIVTATLFLGSVLAAAMLWFRTYNMFQLNQAVVSGTDVLSRNDILALAQLDYSKEIFRIDTKEIEKRVRRHPLVYDVSVHRFPPSGLRIDVVERDLVAVVPGNRIQVADVLGRIIDIGDFYASYDLPIITGAKTEFDSTIGLVASREMNQIIQLISAIREVDLPLYQEISELHFDKKRGLILYLRSSNIPVFLGFDGYARKTAYLSTIIRYLEKSNNLATVRAFDVRFNGQVVAKI